jgi:hypothetical protein
VWARARARLDWVVECCGAFPSRVDPGRSEHLHGVDWIVITHLLFHYPFWRAVLSD